MKLNKILMSTLVGCSLLTPVILSSCSIKNFNYSSNDEEKKLKTIPVPFQNSLYDTWDSKSNILYFNSNYVDIYKIYGVNEGLTTELNNGRNYKKEIDKNDTFGLSDIFECTNSNSKYLPSSSNTLFKTVDEFYTGIKSFENDYEFFLYINNTDTIFFKFNTFNGHFITNPNCNTYIYIYIYICILIPIVGWVWNK